MIIGLTGKYCAGKNYVASLLEARGLCVLDIDKLGYQVLETEKDEIFTRFGADLRREDGSLDRRLLGQKVFGNPEKLSALESIVHPAVNSLTEEWIKNYHTNRNVVLNAALLHRSAFFDRLDKIIIVTAPFFTRILRAKKRDKLPLWEVIKRFNSQKNFNSQYLQTKAEIYIVENPGLRDRGNIRLKKMECRINEILEGKN